MFLINPLLGFTNAILSSVSFLTSVSSGTVPATTRAGDLIVVLSFNTGASLPGYTTGPSTITIFFSEDLFIAYKIATSADAGAVLTATDIIVVFRGNTPIKTATQKDLHSEATVTAPSTQTVTSGSGKTPLIVLAGYYSGDLFVDPRGFTPAKDGEQDNGPNDYLAWKIYNSSPSNVAVSMDDETASPSRGNHLLSFYVELA